MQQPSSSPPFKSPGIRPWIRPILWRYPYLYWPVGVLRQRKNIFKRDFDLLIDGYPRSANTFSVFAFQSAQSKRVTVSSHHHNPASVLAAVSMRKPVMVLIRDPVEAIASWTVFSEAYPPNYNLDTYINYYEIILSVKNRVVVAPFNMVTTNFGTVVSTLNARFGTTFSLPPDGQKADEIFRNIEEAHVRETGYFDEQRVARPSAVRQQLKKSIREYLLSDKCSARIERSYAIYNELLRSSNGE